ncbi:MAG: SpoVG family protein [Clostridia bacterium]|nr:SpoVG family protein [Clostridia bacterium]
MQITDVKIRKTFTEGPMLAVASVTLEGVFVVHDVKVILANDRRFIVMPSRKNADGTYRDIAHPITAEFRAALEETVLAAYEKALAEAPADDML